MGVPCGWVVEKCGCGTCWDGYSPEVRERAAALAIGLMWAATGRQFGPCEITVLPRNPRRRLPLYETFPTPGLYGGTGLGLGGGIYPVLDSGTWRNLCTGGCACRNTCEVPLDGPVADVVEVQVDGEPVDPTAYQVHNSELLVRVDGDCWPVCQRYDVEVPGFAVTYHRGIPVPADVQYATETLACEYAKACVGGTCALPQRLASLSRQGVDVTIAQIPPPRSGVFRPTIRTDIKLVDDVIESVNPYGLIERPEVWSPDMPENRVVTWRGGS